MPERISGLLAASLLFLLAGCMVGPEYKKPPANVADAWIASRMGTLPQNSDVDYDEWWKSFGDPTLNELMEMAYRQNLSLETAGLRVVQAIAQRGFAIGQLYPQRQEATGSFTRETVARRMVEREEGSGNDTGVLLPSTYNQWTLTPLSAGWELDLWGRYRRGIESADADLLASLYDYQDVLVSLLAEVATTYVQFRTLQEQLEVAVHNVGLQTRSVEIVEARFELGAVTELDVAQSRSLLRDTESRIPGIRAQLRQAQDQLCVLLGLPTQKLDDILTGPPRVPSAPPDVIVGVPAQLLRARPDIRRAERDVAAQSARIGIAAADFYPRLELIGNIGLQSESFSDLFQGQAFTAFGGPRFRWAILNYGRIANNVRVEDAVFQQQVRLYEDTVLRAQQEVQDAMAGYLGAQRQVEFLELSVKDAALAVDLSEYQYREGATDYTRVLLSQQFLLQAQDRLVSTKGAVALNLVTLHRSLGGGWQFKEGEALIRPETRAEMEDRIHWGDLLETEEDYRDIDAAEESERDALRWWWPEW